MYINERSYLVWDPVCCNTDWQARWYNKGKTVCGLLHSLDWIWGLLHRTEDSPGTKNTVNTKACRSHGPKGRTHWYCFAKGRVIQLLLIFTFTCLYVLLLVVVEETSYCIRYWLMQIYITVESAESKWLSGQQYMLELSVLKAQGTVLKREWKEYHSQDGSRAVKCCPLDRTSRHLHRWLHKIKPVKTSTMEGGKTPSATSSWGFISSSRLPRKGQLVLGLGCWESAPAFHTHMHMGDTDWIQWVVKTGRHDGEREIC